MKLENLSLDARRSTGRRHDNDDEDDDSRSFERVYEEKISAGSFLIRRHRRITRGPIGRDKAAVEVAGAKWTPIRYRQLPRAPNCQDRAP